MAAPAVDGSTGRLGKLPSAPPPAGRRAAPEGSGGGGSDRDGEKRRGGEDGDSGAVASPDRQRLAKSESNAESAPGAPAGRGTSGDRGGTGGAPRRPAEGDCRAPPPPPSVPVRRRPSTPCRDRGRQRPPLPSPRLPRPPPPPPKPQPPPTQPPPPRPLSGLGPTCGRRWWGMSLLCLLQPAAAAVGASPAPPSRDLGGFLWDQATGNQSYCCKKTPARAEQCGHGSYPMKIC